MIDQVDTIPPEVFPLAGDVWVHKSGELRFVGFVGRYNVVWHSTIETRDHTLRGWAAWAAGAELRLRDCNPVHPQAADAIKIECAVMTTRRGELAIEGWRGRSAGDTLEDAWDIDPDRGYQMIATAPVLIPRSLLSMRAAPAVTAHNG